MNFNDFLEGINDSKYKPEECDDGKVFVIRRSGSEDYYSTMNKNDIIFKSINESKMFFNVKKAKILCEEINSKDNYRVRVEEYKDLNEVGVSNVAKKARQEQALKIGKKIQEYTNRTAKSDTIDKTVEYFIDAGKKSSKLISREFIQDIVKKLDKKSLINIFNALKALTNDRVIKELIRTSDMKLVAGDDEESFEDQYAREEEEKEINESIKSFIDGISYLSE